VHEAELDQNKLNENKNVWIVQVEFQYQLIKKEEAVFNRIKMINIPCSHE
jgi:hypothetical protein